MQDGLRKGVEIAGVVVVRVGDDQIAHCRRIAAQPPQPIRPREMQAGAETLGQGRRKPGIDHDRAAIAADHPDIIRHRRHHLILRRTQHQVTGRHHINALVAVAQRIDLVFGGGGGHGGGLLRSRYVFSVSPRWP